MADYQLAPAPIGTYGQYNEAAAIDPSIRNEFTSAIFRIMHSTIEGDIRYRFRRLALKPIIYLTKYQ